ncbi:nuclear transport factor 2 family protein [Stenotrophomonas sp. SY1]|uniref:nuclear transport factor 2 family protein n=1 Tax=Stenotrophomonas sp. SY1 TaxID=477235 RepID=UPI001E319CC1|nr:nuclear transport factor 2 family protein [Stenotrophomonas sp. SY1]MCD9087010.1 nuclear transport factor 2 family protein [Stenotrophomonas sp. SY1]
MKSSVFGPRIATILLTIAGVLGAPVAAQANDGNVAIVRKAFDDWAAGTGGPYALLADDAVWTITGNSLASRTYSSREAFMSEVIRPFNARMSTGLRPTIRSLYRDGDTVIVFFDASGTARDGKTYANTYAWFLELRDGRIVQASAFFDSIAFNDLWTRVHPVQ